MEVTAGTQALHDLDWERGFYPSASKMMGRYNLGINGRQGL
jgi:hypothetical protein